MDTDEWFVEDGEENGGHTSLGDPEGGGIFVIIMPS